MLYSPTYTKSYLLEPTKNNIKQISNEDISSELIESNEVKKIKASDLLVKCLETEGVEYIFGIPGEENADFMISLLDSKIKFILTRHEQGAAFMADVYGRLTGKVGVCLSTLGPGASNLTTGVQMPTWTGQD